METEDLARIIELLVFSNSECYLDKASIKFGCFTLSTLVNENDTVRDIQNRLLMEIECFYRRDKIERELKKELNLD